MLKIIVADINEQRRRLCSCCGENNAKYILTVGDSSTTSQAFCQGCMRELAYQIPYINCHYITEHMVALGLEKNIISIVDGDLDHGCTGVVCQIGENQFYFSSDLDDGELTAKAYLESVDKEILIHELYSCLNGDFRTEFEDEYEYFYLVLREALTK